MEMYFWIKCVLGNRGNQNIYYWSLAFLILLFSDNCLSIAPQQHLLESKVTLNIGNFSGLSVNNTEPKKNIKTCTKVLADGSRVFTDCSDTTVASSSKINDSGPDAPSINTAKSLLCNSNSQEGDNKSNCTSLENSSLGKSNTISNSTKLNTHLNSKSNSTENSEIASMNDHFNKYLGGLDVDEKRNNINMNASIHASRVMDNHGNGDKQRNTIEDNALINTHAGTNETASNRIGSTTAAGLGAGLCLLLASLAYISLMIWKARSDKHFGNREMLINEDDLGDIHDEDMRHFELKLLDKDGKVIES